ncbi:S41 family peptidase [Streptomyces sp. SM14]|uniref:S41 family peptidase n=1 Tax=Streptomyces sp. SM14 TaxID=1736045 RepID=UPI000CD4E6BC|nr:S41 family peptidase [Streptomyces sp. SM14]
MSATLQPGEISRIVEQTAARVLEHYVFPATAARLAALLRERLSAGAYHQAGEPRILAELVTADLRSVNGDLHLRLRHLPAPTSNEEGAAVRDEMERAADLTMGGIPRVERLTGGVALLELGRFLLPVRDAGDTVTAAFTLVARSEALLIDLRGCRGGDPRTVSLLCSYLLDEHTQLNTMRYRDESRTTQFWTLPYVPGTRYGTARPLFLVTGPKTFSGAEELAYNMQQLKRGKVVGQATGGGAHPQIGFTLHPHLEATVPNARAVNPVSGTNWEGTGVVPDVRVPADDALTAAHRLALEAITRGGREAPSVAEAREELRRLEELSAASPGDITQSAGTDADEGQPVS